MNPGISIWNRLLGVMVVMLAVVGGLFIWQSKSDEKTSEMLLRASVAQRQQTLAQMNRVISRSLENFAYELSLSTLAQVPPMEQIAQNAREDKVDFVAFLRPDLSLVSANDFKRKQSPEALLPPQSILKSLADADENVLFFSATSGGPIQLAFAPLKQEDGIPTGYLITGRYWDRLFMTSLGESTGAMVQSFPITELNARPPGFLDDYRQYRTTDVAVGAMGQPVFAYNAIFDLSSEQSMIRKNRESMHRISYGVLGILVLFFAVLWKWLAYPVRLVSEALETDDPTVLKPILNEDYDWSRIAQRLTESSEARLELTREVQRQQEQARIQEETARVRETLARDLHDGVIQSVYAVGLQLERANSMATKDPIKAQDRISDCKDSLNGIIRELRGFIKGLTPEPLQGKSLQDALEQLIIHSRKSTEAVIDIQISTEACSALSTAQALNIYQLSRELLSNAIRHAEASRIIVRLTNEPQSVDLFVIDNGTGFAAVNNRPGGHGLVNIQDRARQIGAVVTFLKNSPTGTRVHVKVPITKL